MLDRLDLIISSPLPCHAPSIARLVRSWNSAQATTRLAPMLSALTLLVPRSGLSASGTGGELRYLAVANPFNLHPPLLRPAHKKCPYTHSTTLGSSQLQKNTKWHEGECVSGIRDHIKIPPANLYTKLTLPSSSAISKRNSAPPYTNTQKSSPPRKK